MDMVISRWSVIVDNFDLKDAFLGPDETDSPSVVDPDAVLATSTALQRLQPVPGRRTQGIERCCAVELLKFSFCDRCKVGKSRIAIACKKSGRALIPERSDRETGYTVER